MNEKKEDMIGMFTPDPYFKELRLKEDNKKRISISHF